MSDDLIEHEDGPPLGAMEQKGRLVRGWLAILAKVTSPNDPERAAAGFRAFEPFLVDRPDWQFCRRSVEAVAAECGRIPNYSQISRHLDAWAKKNRPEAEAKKNSGLLPFSDDTAGLSVEVRTWVAFYRARTGALVSRSGEARIMGMLERYCPNAVLFLTAKDGMDTDGREVEEHAERRRGWENELEVLARVQSLAEDGFPYELVALLHAALTRYAPSNLPILTDVAPEEMIRRIVRRREARAA